MASPVQFESPMGNSSNLEAHDGPSSSSQRSREAPKSPFSDLRGVQWRINLGILPPSSSAIDDLRRVTADCRRRYASLRRRLLVDSNFSKDGSNSPDLVMDNPLSQNPDSMWGRFFRNAELEKMVDQDLSRLYPEHGSYFQSAACQGMLRRILLLWCLRHPEYGYRQGMHELLAPLLYVLHVDVERLSQIRKLYEDHFTDKFDDLSFPASDLVCNYKSLNWGAEIDDENTFQGSEAKASSLVELDPEIQTVVLLSDAYGAEGELGILLSERFMEHDAYCMFDALMGGARGAVAMAEFFSPSPAAGSHTGLPPVIEASSALYHLLSVVDSSLHSHLVELGVEPQYFALRWLRVLFGREFLLEDLLFIWDEIFAAENGKTALSVETDVGSNYGVLCSPRGAFISAMAVSMLLYLRSSLLATENATSCLQRLLKFPENIDVKKLIRKAKSLQTLALETSSFSLSSFPAGSLDRSKSTAARVNSLPSGSISPRTPLSLVPESYWEEKWRVFHKPEELPQGSSGKKVSTGKQGFSEKLRLSLARTESAPTPSKTGTETKESRSSVRRRLLEDLSRELGTKEDLEKVGCSQALDQKGPFSGEIKEERSVLMDRIAENGSEKNFSCGAEDTCLSGHTGSEDGSFIFSASSSPFNIPNDHENDSEKSSVGSNSGNDRDNDSEKVSVTSRLSVDGNYDDPNNAEKPCTTVRDDSPLPVSCSDGGVLQKSQPNADAAGKQIIAMKDRKLLSGKLQWIWKFGRNASEAAPEKAPHMEALRSSCVESNHNTAPASSSAEGCGTSQLDTTDKNRMCALRNLGQSMLENIQVIESVFQQDKGQVGSLESLSKSILVGKGQVTAVTALKELRKISNLLSEM